jgi:Rps23 Pro-64 3,4-dihydroxylase Tpa1-like proline 4-hydroxylase
MNYKFFQDPFPHLIIHNFYNDDELSSVWTEIDQFYNNNMFVSEQETGSSEDFNGNILKRNKGIFLYPFYRDNWINSAILKNSKKVFHPDFVKTMSDNHWIYDYIKHSKKDTVLLSYYENNDYYKPHVDLCSMSAICNLYKEPKMFSGGNLIFEDFSKYTIPLENNRTIIFPSICRHAVDPIIMQPDALPNYGRYAITHFISSI